MKQLMRMFIFDVRMSFRNFMGTYMLIVPLAILLILRLFLPAVDSSTIKFAIVSEGPNAVEQELIDKLSIVGDISVYPDIESVRARLDAVGTVEGLYRDPDKNQYVSILEQTTKENKVFSYAARYIRQYYLEKNYPDAEPVTAFEYGVPPELSDRTETSPVATTGGAIFYVFTIILSAFLLGLAIVEDKDQGTISALMLSPVSKSDYYLGRSIFPLITGLFFGFLALLLLGLTDVNLLQILIVLIASFSTTLVFGLFVGALGKNEIEAIGIGKVSSMLLLLAVLGTTLLPESWHWTMYWSPAYWIFAASEGVFTKTTNWTEVLFRSGMIIAVSAAYYLLLRKKINAGLA